MHHRIVFFPFIECFLGGSVNGVLFRWFEGGNAGVRGRGREQWSKRRGLGWGEIEGMGGDGVGVAVGCL